MEKNKNLIYEYQNDFKECLKPESDGPTVVSNVDFSQPTIREQLADANRRIAQLMLYVGVPHTVPVDTSLVTLYPARKGNVKRVSKEAASYVVNLQPFRDHFSAVRFKAMTSLCEEKNIVRGIIIDDEGNVECASNNHYATSNPWTRLPITSSSAYLIATLPLEDGEPAWLPGSVELLPQGLAQDVADVTEKLMRDSIDFGNKLCFIEKEIK